MTRVNCSDVSDHFSEMVDSKPFQYTLVTLVALAAIAVITVGGLGYAGLCSLSNPFAIGAGCVLLSGVLLLLYIKNREEVLSLGEAEGYKDMLETGEMFIYRGVSGRKYLCFETAGGPQKGLYDNHYAEVNKTFRLVSSSELEARLLSKNK